MPLGHYRIINVHSQKSSLALHCPFNDASYRRFTVLQGVYDETLVHFAHVRLDAFVVMPDHVHGVVFITSGGRGSAIAPTGDAATGGICPASRGTGGGTALPLPVMPPLVSNLQPQVVGAMALPRPPVPLASRDGVSLMLTIASQYGTISDVSSRLSGIIE